MVKLVDCFENNFVGLHIKWTTCICNIKTYDDWTKLLSQNIITEVESSSIFLFKQILSYIHFCIFFKSTWLLKYCIKLFTIHVLIYLWHWWLFWKWVYDYSISNQTILSIQQQKMAHIWKTGESIPIH